MGVTVQFLGLSKNGDEHGRNVLQEIFRLRMFENCCVLLQLVRHLIDDKAPVIGQSIVGLAQERALFVDVQNAERDSGENVITFRNATTLQFIRQSGGVPIDHVDASIVRKLSLQVLRKSRVQFKNKQFGIGTHPSYDLTGVHSFARAVLGNHVRIGEINFTGNPLHQSLGTGNNGSDLKR